MKGGKDGYERVDANDSFWMELAGVFRIVIAWQHTRLFFPVLTKSGEGASTHGDRRGKQPVFSGS